MKLHGEYGYECIRNSLSSYTVWLEIILPWPALKNKQRMCFELFEVFLTSSADQCFNYFIIFCCWVKLQNPPPQGFIITM